MKQRPQSKRDTVLLLRWVLIIAFSYLLLLDDAARTIPARLALVIATALASNLIIARVPASWVESRGFDFATVLFDAAWVTFGLIMAPHVSSDLFLLYFLVIFVAAIGESLQMIVSSAVVVSVVYGAMLSLHPGAEFQLTTTALLRVPFLFVVALFYGYLVTEIRSRRTEAAEAQLREQAKSELLAAVSHDLRGPLGNAENLLALVLEAQAEGDAADRGLLLRAQVNVRRVSLLVTNLLQAACIERGKVHFQMTPVQLNDVVDDVLNFESGAAYLRGVTLHRDIDTQLPVITADLVQVGRILTNLVGNAVKFTGVGGRVVVRTGADADSVWMSVHDNGPGMSPEQCRELFAPYRRVHLGGYTTGTGLGLYIVKRLAEVHGGSVNVTSALGEGSTFVVSLPHTPKSKDAPARVTLQKGSGVDGSVRRPSEAALPAAQAA